MEITSSEKLPKFQHFGMTLVINFNEQEVEVVNDDGETTIQYRYATAKVCKTSSSNERIEAIIKTKYPTYGAELAAMHKNGPQNDEYLAFRELAKEVAAESFA